MSQLGELRKHWKVWLGSNAISLFCAYYTWATYHDSVRKDAETASQTASDRIAEAFILIDGASVYTQAVDQRLAEDTLEARTNRTHAEQKLRSALELDPKSSRAHLGLARIAILKFHIDDALIEINTGIRLNSRDPELLSLQGSIYFLKDDLARSKDSFRKALEIDAEYLNAMIGMGALCMRVADGDCAVQWFEKATRADKNDAFSMFSLGRAYKFKERTKDAEKAFRSCARMETTRMPSRTAL
jgi:Tfp pilus assembly protein PilF